MGDFNITCTYAIIRYNVYFDIVNNFFRIFNAAYLFRNEKSYAVQKCILYSPYHNLVFSIFKKEKFILA